MPELKWVRQKAGVYHLFVDGDLRGYAVRGQMVGIRTIWVWMLFRGPRGWSYRLTRAKADAEKALGGQHD